MKTLIYLISLSLLSLASAFSQEDFLELDAKLTGLEEAKYIYFWTFTGGVGSLTDSFDIKEGEFKIKYTLKESPSVIYLTGKNFRPRLRIWAENTRMKVSGDINDAENCIVTGSRNHNISQKFLAVEEDTLQQLALVEEYLDAEVAIQYLFFLKDKISRRKLEDLFEKIPQALQNYSFTQRLRSYLIVSPEEIPQKGDQFLDFEAFDEKGKNYKLSELADRYLLLEFGSSYCGPCFFAAPELSNLQKEYAEKIRILSFSLDSREDNWRKGVERLHKQESGAPLLHLWDGKGENGTIPAMYGVEGIPAFVLINKEGEIIDRWEGYSPGSLEEKLNTILK